MFETISPKGIITNEMVAYYYIDYRPNNVNTMIDCFPHFNTTLSIYKSHSVLPDGSITYQKGGKPIQLYFPIRENVMHVHQVGHVERIVIVFKPLGIQCFFNNINLAFPNTIHAFFNKDEIDILFQSHNILNIRDLLDCFLEKRFKQFEHDLLESSVKEIFNNSNDFSVESLSQKLSISRRHLTRIFNQHLGVSIKRFHEIVVFRKIVNHHLFVNPNQSLTKLAYEFNLNDQSHLNKIFKNLTKNTPKSFFKCGKLLGSEDTFWHIKTIS